MTPQAETHSELSRFAMPGLDIEEAKALMVVLWTGFLGQWGPESGKRGRKHHRWKVHNLIAFMDAIGDPFENSVNEADKNEWILFCTSLPGFAEYFSCGCAWATHGGP